MATKRGIIRQRGNSWQADFGRVNGARKMKSYKTKKEAENWLREQTLLIEDQGAQAFEIDDRQRLDVVRAFEALKDHSDITLEVAAKFYADHHATGGNTITVAKAVEDYIQDAIDSGLRHRSITDLKSRLGRFADAFDGRTMNEITRRDADKWIEDIKQAPTSKKHFRTVAGGLFNYAIDKEYVNENPFTSKTRRRNRQRQDEVMPECLSHKQVAHVMRVTEKELPDFAPAMAIAFFAGLRTAELCKLKWEDIDLESRLITVKPEVAKKRRTRHVTIEDNLLVWLAAYRKATGLVVDKGWRSRFDKVRKEAGMLESWPHNAARHTFASCHLLKHNDAARTALQLGHRDQAVLFDHYRALVKPDDAAKFWAIAPTQESNVIQLSKIA